MRVEITSVDTLLPRRCYVEVAPKLYAEYFTGFLLITKGIGFDAWIVVLLIVMGEFSVYLLRLSCVKLLDPVCFSSPCDYYLFIDWFGRSV